MIRLCPKHLLSQAAQISLDARTISAVIPRVFEVLSHSLILFDYSPLSAVGNYEERRRATEDKVEPHLTQDVVKAFNSTADRAQDLIFELIRQKTNELMSWENINWQPTKCVLVFESRSQSSVTF